MRNKIGTLSIVFLFLVICSLSGFTSLQAAPEQVVAIILDGPTSGYTLDEYAWEGGHFFGGPPYTYDWDFDYDGVNFDTDVPNDQYPTWTYYVADEYNEPKDFTVALRVKDGYGSEDIDTLVIHIEPTYELEVTNIDGPLHIKILHSGLFEGFIINNGDERSAPYQYDAEVWWFNTHEMNWEKKWDPDPVHYDGLDPYAHGGNRHEFHEVVTGTELGWHQFWVILSVDGVILDDHCHNYWVTEF
jgi:hypothetical protein